MRLPALAVPRAPVFHANALASVRIGIPRDVTGGKHVRCARLEKLIHRYPPVHGHFRLFSQTGPRPNANPDHDEVRRQASAALERDIAVTDRGGRVLEVKDDTLLLVQSLHEVRELGSHDALERQLVRRDDVHVDLALPE